MQRKQTKKTEYPRKWPKPAGSHSVPDPRSELSVMSLSERMVTAIEVMKYEIEQSSNSASLDILALLTHLYDDIEKLRLVFCRNITPQEFEENSKKDAKAQGNEKLPPSAIELKAEFVQPSNNSISQAQQADFADRFINNVGKFSWNCAVFLLNKLPKKMEAEQKKLTLEGNNTIFPTGLWPIKPLVLADQARLPIHSA